MANPSENSSLRGRAAMMARLSREAETSSPNSVSSSSAGRGSTPSRSAALASALREISARQEQAGDRPMGRGRLTPRVANLVEPERRAMGRGRVKTVVASNPMPPGGLEVETEFVPPDDDDVPKPSGLKGSFPRPGSSPVHSEKAEARPSPPMTPPTQMMGEMRVSTPEKPPVIQHGDQGKPINLTANYIRLLLEPGKGVFEYEVIFDPPVDSRDFKFKMLGNMRDIIGNSKTFDGVTLYLPFKLQQQVTSRLVEHPGDQSQRKLMIKFRRQQRMADCIHLYNVLLKRIMGELNLARLGRQHFDPKSAMIIPQQKLEVWPGYVTAVDEFEGGLLLNCDSSSRVLRTQTVLELIEEAAQRNPNSWQNEVKNLVLGSSVLTRYNNRIYRVDDVDFTMSPRSTFDMMDGRTISFLQYYQEQYNIRLMDQAQPMLHSRIKKKLRGCETIEQLVVLVPELCYMTGLTDAMRSDYRVMKDIATYTRITPNQRHYALLKYLNAVAKNEKATQLLADWGLRLDKDTVSLKGRVVDYERVYFGDQDCPTDQRADWTKELTRSSVYHAVNLVNWILMFASRDTRNAEQFSGTLQRVGPAMGIRVEAPYVVSLHNDQTATYLNALRENIVQGVQLVVIIFPTPRDDRYAAVKKVCCADFPIASQVINSKTLSRPDKIRAIVQKIALQINCKIGGSLWTIQNPYKTCMVIGIDTYHDSVNKARSVAGFVASMNAPLTQWYSRVCIQGPKQELVDGLRICFTDALRRYFAFNKRFPDRIFVFRDGVGDGQLATVLGYEVEQLQACFSTVNRDDQAYEPKFTFVVVQKRINTRLFAVLGGAGRQSLENPPPGTVMDHTVNRRNMYDFFLVSQSVRQGTVSPTHYIVLYDNSGIKPDHVQRYSYKLCHMYFNWPGTVRVPAPCQYAHKVAQLMGLHVRREHCPELSDRLFYL